MAFSTTQATLFKKLRLLALKNPNEEESRSAALACLRMLESAGVDPTETRVIDPAYTQKNTGWTGKNPMTATEELKAKAAAAARSRDEHVRSVTRDMKLKYEQRIEQLSKENWELRSNLKHALDQDYEVGVLRESLALVNTELDQLKRALNSTERDRQFAVQLADDRLSAVRCMTFLDRLYFLFTGDF